MTERPLRIDVVSDTICPWCFVGKRRLERALAARPSLAVEIAWHPFQLNPEMPREGLDRRRYLEAKFGGAAGARQIYDRIRDAGASEGIAFDFDAIATTPNTVDSHRLVKWAGEAGVQDAAVEALFRAYFFDGRDIGAAAVLADVAAACGLERAAIATRLAGDDDRDHVAQAAQRMTAMGVTGVPCYIVDRRYAISGAQDPAVFLNLFDELAREAASAPA
jgi:predicted DsbA family dithiol-disulfide isomerase